MTLPMRSESVSQEVNVSASDRFAWLQNGVVVPLEAVNLQLRCAELGIRLGCHDGALDVEGPHTPELLNELRRWKPHLLLLLRYTPSDVHLYDSQSAFPEHGPILKGSTAA